MLFPLYEDCSALHACLLVEDIGCFFGPESVRAGCKFYDWRERYGKVNEHNGWVRPR